MRGIPGDLKLAGRSLIAAPVVTLAAVLTLALGIGTTTAIFTVANGVMLRPLPVKDPRRLVTITSETALRHGFQAGTGWNHAMWDQLRQRGDAFDGAFAWTLQQLDLSEGGQVQSVDVLFTSGGVFRTLGVNALIGRMYTPADDVQGGGPDGGVAVISYDFWGRRFNGAGDIVGSRLSVEGAPLTIVGVAPQRFRGVDVGQTFDIAIPFGAEPLIRSQALLERERSFLLTVMLRLKRAQRLAQATAVLRAMQPQILEVMRQPPQFVREPFVLVPASTGISDRSRLRQQYERPLVTLSIVSGLVLLIVCANVANLQLARAAARRRELSLRVALGAPRWRLARQLLVEGLLLGGLGGLTGTLFGVWASGGLVAQLPASSGPVQVDLSLDWRVLAFTIGVTLLAVVLFTLFPGLRAMRAEPLEELQNDGRAAGGGRTGRLSGGLVVVQLALSIVIVAAAGLFVRTLNRLANVPLGFQPDGLLVITVNAGRSRVDPAMRLTFQEQIVASVASAAGVTRAAGSVWTPFGSGGGGLLTDARGRRANVGQQVAFNIVTPGWFGTYETAIQTGRDFDGSDVATAPRVAVVNETLSRTLHGERHIAPGDTIEAGPCGQGGCTVVGVVENAVYGGSLRDGSPPTVYVPLAQSAGLTLPRTSLRISIRSADDPVRISGSVTAALRGVDRNLTFTSRPLDAEVNASLAQERLVAILATCFGGIALVLSAVGLYGVTSYAVTCRRREIGIRLALGAQPAGVVRLVLLRIAVLSVSGLVAGVLAALWLSRFIAPLLYGLEPRDPATLAASIVTLAAVAALAAWIPAWRASRIDPAQVLRQQ
jgi:putative ABC transport system permease protein